MSNRDKEIHFADPYKLCCTCGNWVDGVTTTAGPYRNIPCGHRGYKDVCPSWSPVDGCSCTAFGCQPHPERAAA